MAKINAKSSGSVTDNNTPEKSAGTNPPTGTDEKGSTIPPKSEPTSKTMTTEKATTPVRKKRIIQVYKNTSMIHESNPALKDYFAQTTRSVGSYWNGLKKKAGHPFSTDELAILMPPIIDIEPNERGYLTAVDNYFAEMDIKLESYSDKPLELDMSLVDNSKPLSAGNMPVNLEEYVKARWIMSHPDGGTGEDAKGKITAAFYIIDPEKEDQRKAVAHQDEDQALEQYLAIRSNPTRVSEMLVLLGKDPDEIPRRDHTKVLKQLAESRPRDFVKFAQDPNVAAKILLRSLVKYRIVRLEGARYLDAETNKQIGATEMDAILYLLDASNEKILNLYKARLSSALEQAAIQD